MSSTAPDWQDRIMNDAKALGDSIKDVLDTGVGFILILSVDTPDDMPGVSTYVSNLPPDITVELLDAMREALVARAHPAGDA